MRADSCFIFQLPCSVKLQKNFGPSSTDKVQWPNAVMWTHRLGNGTDPTRSTLLGHRLGAMDRGVEYRRLVRRGKDNYRDQWTLSTEKPDTLWRASHLQGDFELENDLLHSSKPLPLTIDWWGLAMWSDAIVLAVEIQVSSCIV